LNNEIFKFAVAQKIFKFAVGSKEGAAGCSAVFLFDFSLLFLVHLPIFILFLELAHVARDFPSVDNPQVFVFLVRQFAAVFFQRIEVPQEIVEVKFSLVS
jgi:hypothetical protein